LGHWAVKNSQSGGSLPTLLRRLPVDTTLGIRNRNESARFLGKTIGQSTNFM
jgi:hypothetical protein